MHACAACTRVGRAGVRHVLQLASPFEAGQRALDTAGAARLAASQLTSDTMCGRMPTSLARKVLSAAGDPAAATAAVAGAASAGAASGVRAPRFALLPELPLPPLPLPPLPLPPPPPPLPLRLRLEPVPAAGAAPPRPAAGVPREFSRRPLAQLSAEATALSTSTSPSAASLATASAAGRAAGATALATPADDARSGDHSTRCIWFSSLSNEACGAGGRAAIITQRGGSGQLARSIVPAPARASSAEAGQRMRHARSRPWRPAWPGRAGACTSRCGQNWGCLAWGLSAHHLTDRARRDGIQRARLEHVPLQHGAQRLVPCSVQRAPAALSV